MPERDRLTIKIFRRVMAHAPVNLWIVATVREGEIVGVGQTSHEAIAEARKKRPDLERSELVILRRDSTEQ